MHLFVGSLLVLAGLACLRYVWAGVPAFEREPPFLALGVLLIGIGAGLGVRARTAHLLARAGLGAGLLAIVVIIARLYLPSGARDHPDDRLVAHFYLFGFALAAAGVVVLLLLLRRARSASAFGAIDLVPLGGLVAALVLGLVWLVADDARLRPCRNGSDQACGVIATTLLESAERAPSAPPRRRRSARRVCSPSIGAGPTTAVSAVFSGMRWGRSTPGPAGSTWPRRRSSGPASPIGAGAHVRPRSGWPGRPPSSSGSSTTGVRRHPRRRGSGRTASWTSGACLDPCRKLAQGPSSGPVRDLMTDADDEALLATRSPRARPCDDTRTTQSARRCRAAYGYRR